MQLFTELICCPTCIHLQCDFLERKRAESGKRW